MTVAPGRAAQEPPEARGVGRAGVRLLVGRPDGVSHHRFTDLPWLLAPGDVLVVNTSATVPAAVDVVGTGLVLHVSTARPDGTWLVELRRRENTATVPYRGEPPGRRLQLPGGATATLRARFAPRRAGRSEGATSVADNPGAAGGRLWVAALDVSSVPSYLLAHGRPIRYGYVERDWPLSAYQTVFATEPGSAEMPSAGRPFTTDLVTRLVAAGVVFAPVTLHTGVASLEAHEPPYPERFEVPATTARLVTQARAAGARVVAVGTTAVRAIETAARLNGSVRPAAGWTDLVVTRSRGMRVIDGVLTGFHEPRTSHLELLAALAGEPSVARCYAEAVEAGYRWHEFGDLNLLLGR